MVPPPNWQKLSASLNVSTLYPHLLSSISPVQTTLRRYRGNASLIQCNGTTTSRHEEPGNTVSVRLQRTFSSVRSTSTSGRFKLHSASVADTSVVSCYALRVVLPVGKIVCEK